jgi:arginase
MSTQVFSYAVGIAGRDNNNKHAPMTIKNSKHIQTIQEQLHWHPIITTETTARAEDALDEILKVNTQLAKLSYKATSEGKYFITLGGDHSSAIGTWSGVGAALEKEQKTLGLIWIDAHLDSHTFDTSPTNNIHGMPLAMLLNQSESPLTSILSKATKLQAENLIIIGARSFEAGEAALIKKLGITVYYMSDINQRGLETIIIESIKTLENTTDVIGLSLDVDSIDPEFAPGVSTPEADGLCAKELLEHLHHITSHPKLIGCELVEFLPNKDIDEKTEKLCAQIMTLMTR